ncbi:MAG: saccharopine dehydrogenase NADP-binding domain-containing protein [Pseudomonadota bacterium]|nr:saccharopine dehydrogenase NADP-binding domain-containing protein [Pseudomonadota bacterium]
MPESLHRILVLGGYGFFGTRICQALSTNPAIHLLIGGRDVQQARRLVGELGLAPGQAVAIDASAPNLAAQLVQLRVDTVIHTAGPFQGQDYHVARAAIDAGANYLDLADGRDFVSGIRQLDAEARARGVFVTSGASSLPALSSAVVDRYAPRFRTLLSIRTGIASGARAPGLATMRGVFSYCGKPFTRLVDGHLTTAFGWLDLQRHRFAAPVGARLLGSCDVPDLTLFPQRYPSVHTVTFHAGFASAPGHLALWAAAQLVRFKLLRSLLPLVEPLRALSGWIEPLVSDKGAMFVTMSGIGHDGEPLSLTWQLVAAQNHGPHIPCGAAISLANKLVAGDHLPHGAMPCMGLLTVEEYLTALHGFDVREVPA